MFDNIQYLTVLMAYFYLTLEKSENLQQTEMCHLNTQVHNAI